MNIDLRLLSPTLTHRVLARQVRLHFIKRTPPKGGRSILQEEDISSTLAMHPSSSLGRQPCAEDFVRHCIALWNGRVAGTGRSGSRNAVATALHIRPNEEGDIASKMYEAITSMKGRKYTDGAKQ